MTWNTTAPDGAQSVKANKAILQANTTYTKTTMNLDHSWDTDVNVDGHHLWAKMPKVSSDPTIGTSLDLAYYAREKTAAESPDNEDVQPFVKNADSEILQLLGVRSCGLVESSGSPAYTLTTKYAHNLTSITRGGVGIYSITFPALPSEYYLPFIGCLRTGGGGLSAYCSVVSGTKTTTGFQVTVHRSESTSTRTDPDQLWFFVFGG